MRAVRVLAWSVAGLATATVGLLLMAQTGPGQRALAQAISSMASGPQRQVSIVGLDGFFPTDMKVERIEIRDDAGIWLRADQAELRWSFASLFAGRLRIDALSAARLEALRPPKLSPAQASSGNGAVLPIEVDLQSLRVDDFHIGQALGGVDSRWTGSGALLLTSGASTLRLGLKRTDGPAAEVKADMRFTLEPFSLEGTIAADEQSKGGVVAALVERPDLDRVSLQVTAKGGPDAGSVDLSAAAEDVATSKGRFEWRRSEGRTDFTWWLDARAPGLPDNTATRLLRQSLRLEGEAVLDHARVLTIRRADLAAGPVRLTLAGRYDIPAEQLAADLTVATDEAGAVADLLVPPANAGRAPIVGPAEIRMKLALGAGGKGRITIDVPDLRPMTVFSGAELAGRAHVELQGAARGGDLRGSWSGTLEGLSLAGIPSDLLKDKVQLSGSGTWRDGDWTLRGARVASDALAVEFEGKGRDQAGELHISVDAPRTEVLAAGFDGNAQVRAAVFFGEDGVRGEAEVGGRLQGKSLALHGRFARDASGISVPSLEGSWASASLQANDLVMTPIGATGQAHLKVSRLADFTAVQQLGQLDARIEGDGRGFDVSLQASGRNANADLAGRLEPEGNEIQVSLSRFAGRYEGLPLKLSAPSRLRVVGARVTVENAAFDLGGGRVTAKGVLDPANSNLGIDVSGLPLKLVETLASGTGLEGTLQSRLQVTGPIGNPRVEASYLANGLRLRRPETALVPALAVQGKAQLVDRRATFDAALSAGGGGAVQAKGKANLALVRPNASVALSGTLNVAPFAPLLGTSINNVAGTLRPDLTLDIDGDKVSGRGTVAVSGLALVLPASGLRLSGGTGTFVLQGDALQVQRLAFQTQGNGEVSATGRIGLNPAEGLPMDLALVLKRALMVNRLDLVATVSSNLKIAGALAKGLDVSGAVVVDRAEIAVGAAEAANYPTVAVREVNGDKPAMAVPAAAASPLAVRLALSVQAPRAVFVRGRGLEAEVGGSFTVNGESARPSVIGGLTLRRGELSLAGRRLSFSRGNVSLQNANTIDPQLDFAASASVKGTTIEVTVKGTPRAPAIAVSSQPELPQDEAMAMLLFGKPASGLSVSELVAATQALAELTGHGTSGGGFFARLRRGLGLDQFSVDTSGTGKGNSTSTLGGTTLQGGKYVAPGVYVGARQGASADTSRGVVEIEVLPHTKLEGDIGADSNGRIGAKLEWDY
jgi:translocation and assembly module TamB